MGAYENPASALKRAAQRQADSVAAASRAAADAETRRLDTLAQMERERFGQEERP